MARAHIYRPIQDNLGNLITDATVAVYQPGTTTPIAGTLFTASSGSGSKANPHAATSGHVDFYLDVPQTVRLGITRPSQPEFFIEDLDIGDPEDAVEAPTLIVADYVLRSTLSVATDALRYYVDEDCEIVSIRASVGTAPTGASIVVDVNKNGTSIFATTPANRPTIADATNTVLSGNPDTINLLAGDYLTFDVDQVGSTEPGGDLRVVVRTQVI